MDQPSEHVVTVIVWQPGLLLHAPALGPAGPGSEAPAVSGAGALDVGTWPARGPVLSLSAAILGAAGAIALVS